MATEEFIEAYGLNRLCQLCGQALRYHAAPPYGEKSEDVGALGFYCPTDARLPSPTDAQQ